MNEKKRRFLVICIAVLIVFGTLFSLYIANLRAMASAEERAETVLIDSAREQAATFVSTLDGHIQILESLAASLDESNITEPSEIERSLDSIVKRVELGFSDISLIFPNGSMATQDRTSRINLADRPYFQRAMQGKTVIDSLVGRQTGLFCVVLAVPYYHDGAVAGVLRGIFFEADLRDLLTSHIYGGGGYSLLVSSSGDIIINSETAITNMDSDSIFKVLRQAKFDGNSSLDELRESFLRGISTTVHYDINDASYLAVLLPLESDLLPENDWCIFNVINETLLSGEVETSRGNALESMWTFAAFVAMALFIFLLLEGDYRRKKQHEAEAIHQREELFRVATEQSGKYVMRYDIVSRTARFDTTIDDGLSVKKEYENAPESIIERKIIDPSCVEAYRDFFYRIDGGESPLTTDILMRKPDGSRRWYKHSSTTVCDSIGRPHTAIISYYDDTEQRERELAYAKWQQELESVSDELTALYEWNLTLDAPETQRGQLAAEYGESENSFNARTEYFVRAHVHDEDRAAFAAMMNREHLLAMFYSKSYRNTLDYRYTDGNAPLRWRNISVQLVQYPDNQNIKAYITNRDIDEEKRAELALLARSQMDYLTGAYNRETFINRVNAVIDGEPSGSHALLMVDVDSFKSVNDTLGHDAGDRLLSDFVSYMRSVLRADDIIGRIGGDEFMICLPDIPFDAAIVKKANQLCSVMRRKLSDSLSVSVSIGIAVYPRDGVNFDELYLCADSALYHAKNSGKDGFALYKKGMSSTGMVSKIDPHSASQQAQAARRAVLMATDDDELFGSVSLMLEPEYSLLRVTDGDSLAALLGGNSAIHAVILDTDTSLGYDILASDARRLASQYDLAFFAVTDDRSETAYLELVASGAALVFEKPISRDVILLRMNMLYSAREAQYSAIQNAYRNLQSTDEQRYREVLSATGTTVFIYDVNTRAYQADLLPKQATDGLFTGFALGDELTEHGIVSKGTIDRLRNSITAIAGGATDCAVHNIRLKLKNGERRWYRIRMMKMTDSDALTPKILITANDINEQVEADETLRFRAERDALTGLYNRSTFFEKASEMIAAHEAGYYVMSCMDIDNFKVVNDQYGTTKGDEILKSIADMLRSGFGAMGGICCRVMGDHFAVLYPASFIGSEEVSTIRETASGFDSSIEPMVISTGRYIVCDKSLDVNSMFDRASIAKAGVKGRFDVHIALYDESMREHLLREQEIINDMNGALAAGQFEAWYQPQYNHATGALIGAEALVRWRHPVRGLIPPSEFIPVFERNGFVYEMDKFIWERCCQDLRRWLEEGRAPLPVSVNVSRYDILRDDFYEVITGCVKKYDIPVELLRLEITESAFAKSENQIINMVRRLTSYGFTVEIDDFGSGYSSLNTLKDVPADILKLDMRFLEGSENTERGGNILESIIRMAKWLGMPVIAEGVETAAQADYLVTVGCSYVQGYLYAKPMPVQEYEALAPTVAKEHKMSRLETIENLDNNSFWDPDSMDTLIFNSYVGGACIFEYANGITELLRVNEKYAQALGGDKLSVHDALALRLEDIMDADNVKLLYANIENAVKTGAEASCEVKLRNAKYIHVAMQLIAKAGNRMLFYCSVLNMTELRQTERRLLETSEQMRAIMENVNSGISAVIIGEGRDIDFIFANERYYSMFGYTSEQFERELPSAFELVLSEDRERIADIVSDIIAQRGATVYEYRCIKRDGSIINVRCNASVTKIEGVNERVLLSVITDITKEKQAEQEIIETSDQLYFLNDVSRGLLTDGSSDAAISDVLRKILSYFDGNRAYVFELDWEHRTADNTYEICADGITAEIDSLHDIPFENIDFWLHAFDAHGHVNITDVDALGDDRANERETLQRQEIKSLVAVSLRRDGRIIGFMGVDDPRRNHSHINHMEALGDYMAVILTRRDLNAKIANDNATLTALMNDTPGGFVRLQIKPDGSIVAVYINKGFCTMLGASRDDIMKYYAEDAMWNVHPEDIQMVLAEVHNAIATGETGSLSYRLQKSNGEYIRLMVFGRPTHGQRGEVFLNLYFADMYEQDKLEEHRRELMDNLPCGAGIYELDGNKITIVYLNKRYHELVGHNITNIGKTSDLFSLHHDDRALLEREFAAALKENRDCSCTLRILHGDGNYRSFRYIGKAHKRGEKLLVYATFFPIEELE